MNRSPARLTSILLLGTVALASPALAADGDFFRSANDAGAKLSADQIYPRGRIFPFAYFSVGGGSPEKTDALLPEDQVQADLSRAAKDGLQILGPQYELNDRVLKDSAQHGFKTIYLIRPTQEDGSHVGLDDVSKIDLEVLIASFRKRIQAALAEDDQSLISWWYLKPAELRSWRKAEMAYFDAAVAAIRELDPLKRPIWMYEPAHRSASGLKTTTRLLDIVGKGMYVNYAGCKDQRVWCRWTIEQEREAIAEVNPNAIPLAVPEMFQQPTEEDLHLIPAWVRHDTYCALVAGAKGVVVFSHRRRPNFSCHETYYQSYAKVQRELCGPAQLGQVFLFGERREDLSLQVVEGPKTVKLLFPSGGVREPIEYPSVNWLDVAYGKDRYLFAVNSANEPVKVEIDGLPTSGLTAADAFGGADPAQPNEGQLTHDLPALGVAGWRFSAK